MPTILYKIYNNLIIFFYTCLYSVHIVVINIYYFTLLLFSFKQMLVNICDTKISHQLKKETYYLLMTIISFVLCFERCCKMITLLLLFHTLCNIEIIILCVYNFFSFLKIKQFMLLNERFYVLLCCIIACNTNTDKKNNLNLYLIFRQTVLFKWFGKNK